MDEVGGGDFSSKCWKREEENKEGEGKGPAVIFQHPHPHSRLTWRPSLLLPRLPRCSRKKGKERERSRFTTLISEKCRPQVSHSS